MDNGLFILSSLVAFLLLGIPIAFSLGLTAVAYFIYTDNLRFMIMVATRTYAGIDSFELLAIPLFVIAGDIMYSGKISQMLLNLAKALLGSFPGSTAIVATVSAMFFSAMSGSGPATVAAIGSVVAPSMKEEGYPPSFSAALVSTAGPLGIMIPPSIMVVVYGVTTNTSVGHLLLSGVYPGLLFGALIIIYTTYLCKKHKWGIVTPFSVRVLVKSFFSAIPALMTPIIILGGIYGGFFTPTEASAVAVFYALAVGMFYYRTIKLSDIPRILKESAATAATVMIILACVSAFSFVLTRERIPEYLTELAMRNITTPMMFLLVANVIYIIAGLAMNGSSAIILIAPILHPIALRFGIDPVFFGALTVANLAIGMLTPPLAIGVFIGAKIFNVETTEVFRYAFPFTFVMIIGLVLMALTPSLVTWLPNTMMG